MKFLKSRTLRQGTFAVIITILGIVLILTLYYVLSTLSTRFHWSIDMTPDRMFEITQESIDFLENLNKDVNIFVLNREDDFINAAQPFSFQANEVIRRYETFGTRVNLEYIDLIRNPTFAARFSEADLRPNQILVESPQTGRYSIIEFRDLFNIVTGQGGQTSVRSSKAEQIMTSAILNVTSDKQIKISVLGGYNQVPTQVFYELLEMNNFEIIHENLATVEEIDPEATIAFLISPARDITENDLRKLDNFLNNNYYYGKTLFIVTGAEQTPMSQMPNLYNWLVEWGISAQDSVLFEMDPEYRFAFDDPFIGFVDYSGNETALMLSETVRAQNLYVASFYSSPLSILFSQQGSRVVEPLLQTSSSSGIFTGQQQISEADFTGPHPVLILSTMSGIQNNVRVNSHVLVSGSLSSLAPFVLGEVNFANSAYFIDLFNTLSNREDTVRIQDKSFSITTIHTTLAQARIISVMTMILLPLGMLATGVVVWLRRRHR